MPVLISPTGVQAVHPDGEVAVARAAAGAGTAMGLSSFASKPIEAVIAANETAVLPDVLAGLARARSCRSSTAPAQAGAKGIILTLDWSFAHRRDWGSPAIPDKLDLKAWPSSRPQVLLKPRWLRDFARAGGPPDLGAPNMTPPGGETPTFFGAYGEWMMTPPPTWDDVAWLCSQWEGPLVVKGITHPDDARAAVQAGAAAISVSNHGGNNLDGTPAAIRALPGVAEAVGGEIEILFDGGIRRGSRRREGRRARRPRGHDRPRRAVGAGRQRPGGGRERARDHARGHHGDAERDRRGLGGRPHAHDLVVPPGFARTPNHQPGSWLPAEP